MGESGIQTGSTVLFRAANGALRNFGVSKSIIVLPLTFEDQAKNVDTEQN